MIIGQTVMTGGTYYSPWFPRQGDAATFSAQVIALSAGTLKVCAETKNLEDTDGGGGHSTNMTNGTITLTGAGVGVTGGSPPTVTGFKELVRFRYEATHASAGNWFHFRVLPPAWQQN